MTRIPSGYGTIPCEERKLSWPRRPPPMALAYPRHPRCWTGQALSFLRETAPASRHHLSTHPQPHPQHPSASPLCQSHPPRNQRQPATFPAVLRFSRPNASSSPPDRTRRCPSRRAALRQRPCRHRRKSTMSVSTCASERAPPRSAALGRETCSYSARGRGRSVTGAPSWGDARRHPSGRVPGMRVRVGQP